MNRSQWILSGVLAVQVLLLIVTAPWSQGGGAEATRVLFPELESFTPTRLEIHESDERSVVLARRGDNWVLEEADGYPADSSKVDDLLDSLGEIRVRRPVVSSDRYHGALKVEEDDHERRLRIWDDSGSDPEIDLLVGTSPNYRLSHVRRGDEDRVYEARGISAYEMGSESGAWIDKKLVDVVADNVTSFTLTNGHGTLSLVRASGTWTLASAADTELDQSAVDSLVRSVSSLYLSEPAGPVDPAVHGFDSPLATVELTTEAPEVPDLLQDGGTPDSDTDAAEIVTVVLGSEVPDGAGKRYASRSGFDFAVVLSKYDADKLNDQTLDDLYPAPEE